MTGLIAKKQKVQLILQLNGGDFSELDESDHCYDGYFHWMKKKSQILEERKTAKGEHYKYFSPWD